MSILDGALRQLKHNDGSEGFVFAYDKEITEREVAELEAERDKAKKEADDWYKSCQGLQQVIRDIGTNLGATKYELVNPVARQRMAELSAVTKERDQLRAIVAFADARINRMIEQGESKCP